MDLKRLDTFRIVARHESLRRAADVKNLTVPAVSIQIKTLEEELGAKLFHHHAKKVILTDKGRAFLAEMNRVFEALDRARVSLLEPESGSTGTLAVALHADLMKLMAPKIADFVKSHPKLDVTVLARSSRESVALVAGGEIDIGVGFFKKLPRSLTRRKIQETNISLVFPAGHPLQRRKLPSLHEISEYRLVMRRRSSPTRRMIDDTFSEHGVIPPSVLEVGRCQSVMEFVRLGLGVGLVHSICGSAEAHGFAAGGGLVQVEMDRTFGRTDVSVITRKDAILGAAHKSLMRAFLDTTTGDISGHD